MPYSYNAHSYRFCFNAACRGSCCLDLLLTGFTFKMTYQWSQQRRSALESTLLNLPSLETPFRIWRPWRPVSRNHKLASSHHNTVLVRNRVVTQRKNLESPKMLLVCFLLFDNGWSNDKLSIFRKLTIKQVA